MRKKGFTLIEMLVVIAMLAIVGTIVVGVAGDIHSRHNGMAVQPVGPEYMAAAPAPVVIIDDDYFPTYSWWMANPYGGAYRGRYYTTSHYSYYYHANPPGYSKPYVAVTSRPAVRTATAAEVRTTRPPAKGSFGTPSTSSGSFGSKSTTVPSVPEARTGSSFSGSRPTSGGSFSKSRGSFNSGSSAASSKGSFGSSSSRPSSSWSGSSSSRSSGSFGGSSPSRSSGSFGGSSGFSSSGRSSSGSFGSSSSFSSSSSRSSSSSSSSSRR